MRRLTRRQRTAALVLAAVSLCLLTLDLGGGGLRSAHSGVRGMLGALYRGTDGALGPVRRFVQGIPSAGTNESRVRALEHENAVLQGRLAAQAANRQTAAQLATLQLAADSGGYPVIPARVIALGPGQGFEWTITLDAGSRAGVAVGQSVTDGNGLVGRVLHADPSTSVVLLGADPGSGVGARDVRNGQIGVATGDGTGGFTFVPLDPAARIRVGDGLVTGPAGATSFVPGLAVGTVRSVRTSADGSTQAAVTATAPATSLDLVGVIALGGTGSTGSLDGQSPRAALTPSAPAPTSAAQR